MNQVVASSISLVIALTFPSKHKTSSYLINYNVATYYIAISNIDRVLICFYVIKIFSNTYTLWVLSSIYRYVSFSYLTIKAQALLYLGIRLSYKNIKSSYSKIVYRYSMPQLFFLYLICLAL